MSLGSCLARPNFKQLFTLTAATTICSPFPSAISHRNASTQNRLDLETINQNIRRLEYAIRGPLVTRAAQLSRELRESNGASGKPFKSIINANIGDCQAMHQKPITYIRQVVACAADTSLLKSAQIPDDVKGRVRELLSYCGGQSAGSYSESCGVELVRRHIAEYISERDGGVECDWQNVYLGTGATDGVKTILSFINQSRKPGKPVGVMIPIPQYPLYSATLCEFGIYQANYYLNEEAAWRLEIDELKRAYEENKDRCDLKAIVVINPGNPTGSVLSEENIIEILDFAAQHKLMVLADEVYQHNIYAESAKFHSFKKVMFQKTSHRFELASLMSASKGFMGECGLRGGYCELANFDENVRAMLYKAISSRICSSVLGQFVMDCVVKPPERDGPSHDLYMAEKGKVLSDLKRKAKLVADTFNSVDGIKTNEVAGSMYAFPRLQLPRKAIEEANLRKLEADFFYAFEFLENYGVCVVPGSGFGQKPGTHHFRTTILPPTEVFEDMMDRFKRFHKQFLERYS